MVIERVLAITPEIVEAFDRLVPQLTRNSVGPQRDDLEALVGADTNVLLVARRADGGGTIVGAGSVSTYRAPTGVRAIIEDLVVDASARGQGIGEALMRALMGAARQMGATGVSLTSNRSREAANRLYLRIGFNLRDTNCYIYRFPS